jgi:hypothetical protein
VVLFLALSAAWALDTDAVCDPVPREDFFVVPGDDATGVPLDVELAVAAYHADCRPGAYRFRLRQGETLVHEETVAGEPHGRFGSKPGALLQPNTAYTLELSSDAAELVVPFTTGEALAEPLGGTPRIGDLDASWSDSEWASLAGLYVNAHIEPATGAWSMIGLEHAEQGALVAASPEEGRVRYRSHDRPAGDVCVRPVQWSATGTRAYGDEECTSLDEPDTAGEAPDRSGGGCFSRSAAVLVLPILLRSGRRS